MSDTALDRQRPWERSLQPPSLPAMIGHLPKARTFIAIATALFTTACGLPRDPERTSERIASTHELRVGLTDNPPWTSTQSPEPTGIEPELVRGFASRMGAKVLWSRGSETSLAQALKRHELDLAIGGFDAKTPWKSIAGLSQPFSQSYDKQKHVMLTAPGENAFVLTLDAFLTDHMRASKGAAR